MMPASEDPVVKAMEAGAGLPVLEPLDRLLEERSLNPDDAPEEQATIASLLDAVDAWLDGTQQRLTHRLERCHQGPLKDTIRRHLAQRWDHAHEATRSLREACNDHESAPWARVIQLLDDLQRLREDAAHLNAATAHLLEIAHLLEDVPDDEDGTHALDHLNQLEAQAATETTPEAWARRARRLEQQALDAIRLQTPTPPQTTEPPQPSPTTRTSEPAPDNASPQQEDAQTPRSPAPQNDAPLILLDDPPHDRPSTAQDGPPAGPSVLEHYEAHTGPGDLRHGPFWAPLARDELPHAPCEADAALEKAREHEVDLVDIDLAGILAIPTGPTPQDLRERIAQRAEAITRQDPTRPAREAFLDHVHGKLPHRYRETPWGQTLLASIAHAITTEDAWEASGPDYEETLERMLAAELDRTPAVDLAELARSLVGESPHAHKTLHEAAQDLARADDDVTYHEDGILVKAHAAREDPDALYELRHSLENRLDPDRAQRLIETLITTGETTP